MQCDYQIEDILSQTDEFLIYQATGKDGGSYTLTRLKYPAEVLDNLRDGRFEKALSELKGMQHSCLRPIVDGGLDPVDHQPWIATRSWEGKSLEECVAEGSLGAFDIQRLEAHGKSLIAEFVDRAGALDFRPSEVVLATAVNGEPIVTFAFDYLVWFRDLAMGYEPGYKRDAKRNFQELLSSLPSPKDVSRRLPLATAVLEAKPAAEVGSVQTSTPVLASAQGGSGGAKSWLAIAILSSLVVGGGWFAIKLKNDKERPKVDSEQADKEPVEKSETPFKKVEDPKPTPASKPEPKPVPPVVKQELAPEKPKPVLQARPAVGAMSEVSAGDPESLEENAGYWILLKGKVKNIGNGVELSFENSNLKARLLEGNVSADLVDKAVIVVGRLIDQANLEVERPGDIEVFVEIAELPKKEVYGIEDERQLRTLEGQEVALLAEVRRVKASGSGKTLYLVFNDTKPEFAAAIRSRYAKDDLDREYLDSLVGKKVKVTGKVDIEAGYSERLVIFFKKKMQLEVSE